MRIIAFLALVAGCGGPDLIVRPPPEAIRAEQTTAWLAAIDDVAEAGDWLVIRGYHPTDNLVVAATNIPLSHVALFDKARREIVEAVGEGVRKKPLEYFVDHSHRLLVIRPKWWSPKAGLAAVRRARKVIGKPYDFLGTIGGGDKDRFYCSELVMLVYNDLYGPSEHIPRVIEPGQMYLFGRILFDSGWRD